ncbi:phosphoserine phosphatase SerB [Arenibaculum pallidiluteum]|uniref:phosphoserine phosphatase SerB n=1 Tax=Arenibaculum pallidiluteum TaxID=2812559 RepID=UPI001A9575E2|nr:phosphoserine phosphatase SerB [Arenibaculum pallidiluteum]
MDLVLTLIAAPERADLDDSTVSAARAALRDLGAEVGRPDWLAAGIACDLPFGGLAIDQALAAADTALPGRHCDLVVQPLADRRKRLLVADMESTIIHQEMLDELAEMVGIRDKVAAITWRAMNGEIDFKDALRERVALLAGLPVSALEESYGRVTLMPGARELVATMRANGARCVLVSGGFKFFTARIRERLGFDADQANDLEIDEGRLTGRPVEPILDKDAKLAALIRIAGEQRIPMRETMSVGDGANDLPMLLAAGLGVAYHAKPAVASEARSRIDHADLTALLYAQGYRDSDIRS